MILDTLSNIEQYKGISTHLDTAIDFLQKNDLSTFADGKYEIDGNNVFVMVQSPTFKAENHFEAHRNYADIQIALLPGETMEWLPYSDIQEWQPYDPDIDFQRGASQQAGIAMTLEPHMFVIFFPQDGHKPGLGSTTGRKAVVKIRVAP